MELQLGHHEPGAARTPIYYDCTYVIQAEAFDGQGRSGAPYAKTVRLNRMLPLKPAGSPGGATATATSSTSRG